MPLVINGLGSRHTHTHTYRCANQSNFKKPGARRPRGGTPGLITNAIFIVLLSNPACPCNVKVICYANNKYMWRFIKLISSYYDYGIVAQIMILIRYLCCDSKEDDWLILYTNSQWSAHHNILVYLYR